MARGDLGTIQDAQGVRQVAMDVRGRIGENRAAVTIIGGVANNKPVIVVATNQPARDLGFKAGDLVKVAAGALGGGGGGKPDLAQGGGTDPNAIQDAIAAAAGLVEGGVH